MLKTECPDAKKAVKLYLTLHRVYTKVNSKWIRDLKVKAKLINL